MSHLRHVLLALLLSLWAGSTCAQLDLAFVDTAGGFSVRVDGQEWLHSGQAPAFALDGQWLSPATNTLALQGNTSSTGSDALGSYTETSLKWGASGRDFVAYTNFRVYNSGSLIIFEQLWSSGAGRTNVSGGVEAVASSFPSFALNAPTGVSLGCIGYLGTFIDDSTAGPNIGVYPKGVVSGSAGGPMIFFDRDSNDALVLTPFTNFMTASFATNGSVLQAGVLGSVQEVPPNYSISFALSYNNTGINNAFTGAGDRLLKYHGKTRAGPSKDFTLQYLGYNTDHGAYYYYNPEPNGNFNTTLVDVYQSSKNLQIPYQWILLDSWWYFKGPDNGVKNWTAMPSIFPPGGIEGMVDFHSIAKWPVIGHNRYWSNTTDYATQNGGKFAFSDTKYKMVVPLEQEFWDYLLSTSKQWGLYTYEQDWLYNEFLGVPLLTQNATMARTWLLQMGNAAISNNLTIQYCMPYPRHALQSVEILPVTQIRASDDYVPSAVGPDQWRIGSSSMFAHAVGLAPFKDSFWTTEYQPGSSTGPTGHDPAVYRESVVSTLSTGPVTPSDGVKFQNKNLIMRSCRNDGRLINPDRPATTMDVTFKGSAFGSNYGPQGQVWATYSTVNGLRYDHVFATELRQTYHLVPAELTLDRASGLTGAAVAYIVRNTTSLDPSTLFVQPFSASSPMALVPVSTSDFQLWHVSPVLSNGVAVLGDLSKWVPVAATRISHVAVDGSQVQVTVQGEPGEVVTITFAKVQSATAQTSAGTCTVGSSGSCVAVSKF